jgi:hypothetical protein
VFKVLGGVSKVAALTRSKYNRAWNWTAKPTFPADTYDAMIKALMKKKYTAPPSLWRQVPPNWTAFERKVDAP